MSQKYTIALIQADFSVLEMEKNLLKAFNLCKEAVDHGAKLICLPEAFYQGYENAKMAQMVAAAETINSEVVKKLCDFAKAQGVYLVAPMLLKNNGEVENTSILINDAGEIVGTYAKTHTTRFERPHMARGRNYEVWNTPLGKIGLLICLDICYPEPAALLMVQGADLIVISAAWRDVANFAQTWDNYVPTRAIDTGTYIAAVNRCGLAGQDEWFSGGSQVCSSGGYVLCKCGKREETILYQEVDPERFAEERKSIGIVPTRHPEDYAPIANV